MEESQHKQLEWEYGVVDLSVNSTTVSSNPAILKAVYVNTVMSAHACPIKDDTTSVFTLPAGSCAGDKFDFEETRFITSLVVDPDDAATGSITLMYKRLGFV